MRVFTSLLTPGEARERYRARLRLDPLEVERCGLGDALGRVLAEDIRAAGDLPPFDRSTVDGYAVRAADTAGAAREEPARLALAGEVLMGAATSLSLAPGQAVRVPTGGMLPAGADAVVMQERTDVSGDVVAVRRAAAAGENVITRGEDVRAGALVLQAGRRLRPQDLGILAGLGYALAPVRRRPRVAIFSTGDELVAADRMPSPGQLRDMNLWALAGQVAQAGGLPVPGPILPDVLEPVVDALGAAVRDHDMVLVSGGSSVGDRDVVVDAIAALGPPGIIVHGVALKPGKPTVLALTGDRPVIGLPGNPVSAMVIFDVFVKPILDAMLGVTESPFSTIDHHGTAGAADDPRIARTALGHRTARAAEPLPGAGEREEHVRVTLEEREGTLWARPLPGKSGLLTSMVRADGIVVVPAGRRIDAGESVEVRILPL